MKQFRIRFFSRLNYYTANEEKSIVLRKVAKVFFFILKKIFLNKVIVNDYCGDINLILRPSTSSGQMFYFLSNLKVEDDIFTFLNEYIEPEMTVLDIGANIGLYTLFFSKKVGKNGKVISFEPFNTTYKQLIKNLELNKFNTSYIYNLALSDSNQLLPIYIDKKNDGENSFLPTKNAFRRYNINLIRFDDFWVSELQEKNVRSIDIVKIDVEGWEHKVLIGMEKTLMKMYPLIIMEFNGYKFKDESLMAFRILKSYNYRCFLIKNGQFIEIDESNLKEYDNKLLDFIYCNSIMWEKICQKIK